MESIKEEKRMERYRFDKYTKAALDTIIRVFAHMKIRYLKNTQYFLSLYGISN